MASPLLGGDDAQVVTSAVGRAGRDRRFDHARGRHRLSAPNLPNRFVNALTVDLLTLHDAGELGALHPVHAHRPAGRGPRRVVRSPHDLGLPEFAIDLLYRRRLHRRLLEILPGGARTSSPAARPATCCAPRRRLTVIDAKIRAADKQLRLHVNATGNSLDELNGIGPSEAARHIGDIGDIARFRTAAHFASGNGTAPIEASSGDQQRHRLSRLGNRRINRVLHIMAIVQLRHDTPGRAYHRRRLAEGKTTMEALRALKRHLSDVVYQQMLRDAKRARTAGTGPGGQSGATLQSSADGPIPTAASSDKSQPGPATRKRRTKLATTP
jgi:hypothetical protein